MLKKTYFHQKELSRPLFYALSIESLDVTNRIFTKPIYSLVVFIYFHNRGNRHVKAK